jgi:diguanylate cyclase (GGDEF)-like protein/PAS domain S-box-containing protein
MADRVDRETSAHLFSAMDSLPSMVAYWDTDLICRYANRAYQQWFRPGGTTIGASIQELLGPDLFAQNEHYIDGVLRGEPQAFERMVQDSDGIKHYNLAHYVPDFADGKLVGFLVQVTDITPIKQVQIELLRQTATLRSVTEAIPATVAVLGTDTRYRFVNTAFERWWGTPQDRVIGHTALEVLGESEYKRRGPFVQRAWAGETVSFQLDYPSPDGTTYVSNTYIPLRLQGNEVDGLVVVSQDVTTQRREELRLQGLSQHDPLTGLLNRAGLEEHLERAQRAGSETTLAMLYIDLDHFKAVNDLHGHAAGDQILQIFAKRMTHLVRPTDAIARLGGDEFIIALSGIGQRENADGVVEKVLAAANAPFRVGALRLNVGASVGVAFSANRDVVGWQALIEHADAQMLKAKAAGRGR